VWAKLGALVAPAPRRWDHGRCSHRFVCRCQRRCADDKAVVLDVRYKPRARLCAFLELDTGARPCAGAGLDLLARPSYCCRQMGIGLVVCRA